MKGNKFTNKVRTIIKTSNKFNNMCKKHVLEIKGKAKTVNKYLISTLTSR